MSEPSEYGSAVQPLVPIFEVAFKNGMWWSIPAEMSQQIYEKYRNNEDAGHTWDWGSSRAGSWQPDGEETYINRYVCPDMGAAKGGQRSSTISALCVGRRREG